MPQTAHSSNNEPSRVNRIIRGTVRAHFKDIGLYLVSPTETSLAATGLVIAADMTASSPGGTGVVTESNVITTGTQVILLVNNAPVQSPDSRSTFVAIILGVDNTQGKADTSNHPLWALTAAQAVERLDYLPGIVDKVRKAIQGASGLERLGDRSAGRPLDLADGDWITYNPLKGYLAVTQDRVSVAGGPMTGLHLFSGRDTCILNTGSRYIEDGASYRRTVYTDGEGFTDFSGMALTVGGSLGAVENTSEVLEQSRPFKVTGTKEDTFPVWRHVSVKGQLVSGSLISVNIPTATSGPNDGSDPQHPVVSDHSGYDGVRTITAVHSASMARTPYIPILNQLEDESGKEGLFEEAEGPSGDVFTEITDMGYATHYADLMYELMKRKFVERYLSRAKARTKGWKTFTAEEICTKVFGGDYEDPSIPALGEDEPCYKLTDADMVEHADPVSGGGAKIKSAKSESFVHLSPSGAVVLSDSFGSEIRMEGGNITITCPGDLKLLPGRDLLSLVPRDASVFAQGRLDLASDKGEVAIKAKKGLSIASVDGSVSVEALKEGASGAESMEDRKDGKSSGVVIRSASTVAVLGKNVRVGLQAPSDKTVGGRQDTSGALVLDAGSGNAVVSGSSVYVAGRSHVSMSTEGAGIGVTGTAVCVGGNAVAIPASSVKIGGSAMKLNRPFATEKGVEIKQTNAGGGGDTTLSVKGNVLMSKSLVCKTMTARTALFAVLAASNASDTSGIQYKGSVPPAWNDVKGVESGDVSTHDNGSKAGAQAIKGTAGKDKLFSAAGTLAAGLYYPTSEDYHCGGDYFITQARWQRKLKAGGGKTWTPEPVKNVLSGNEGLPKPGLEALTDMAIVKEPTIDQDTIKVEDRKFSEAFVVNADVK